MPKPPRTYTRLTRRSASVASYKSLWLAADHLLIVNSNGYTEEYQRLQFRDIKGLFLIGSDRRLYWGLPWGVIAAFSGVALANAMSNDEIPVFSGLFLGLSLIALVWNHLLGAGCRTFVVTGVQTAPLPSIVRRRKARKIFARLQPLIAAAQADMAASAPPASPPALDPVSSPSPLPPPSLA